MKMNIQRYRVLLLVLWMVGTSCDSKSQSASSNSQARVAVSETEWPVFRGDQQLTGRATASLPDKPELLYSFQTDGGIKSSPVVSSGTIFIGSAGGVMYALNLTNGREKWNFKTRNGIEAPALLVDGALIFGTLDGTLYRLNASTGEEIWNYKTDNQIIGSANYLKNSNR